VKRLTREATRRAIASIPLVVAVHAVPLPQPSPFDGKWSLTPEFTTSCSAGELSASLTVGQVSTRQTTSDSLAITSNVAVSGGAMTYLAIHTLQTHLESATRTFVFSGPVTGSAERSGLADTLTGKLDVRGAFVGSDSLMAQVEARLSMVVHGPAGASSGSCAPVKTRIVATRIRE
jgi:hypothetical protein